MRSHPRRSTSDHRTPPRPVEPQRQEELAFTHCLRRLTAAARSEAELAESMGARGYPGEVIEAVLDRLRDAGYVDDREFARAWVESRTRTRALAAPVLRAELIAKGLPAEVIAAALGEADTDALSDQARRLVRRRLGAGGRDFDGLADAEKERLTRRLVAMLARRGHSSGSAYGLVREVIAEQRDAG